MKKLSVVLLLLSVGAIEAEKIRCVCNDKTIQLPSCGICGVELGHMEKADKGVACICENGLKLEEIPCAEVCKLNGGWSGNYK